MFRINSSKKWIKSSIAFGAARSAIALSFLTAIVGQAQSSYAINFTFDYSYDGSNNSTKFFDSSTTLGQSRRATLEAAADYFEPFTDNLSAISPGNGNSWTPNIFNPVTGAYEAVSSGLQNIGANEIVVFVGARNLGGSLGTGGAGGYGASGNQTFFDLLKSRGQTGALSTTPTDFAPWGGSLSFDNTVTWNSTTSAPQSGQNDFLSVAIHELGHLLGFGIAPSWNNTNNFTGFNPNYYFTGSNSVAAYGGNNVPLTVDKGHWKEGTMSTVNGISQETAMDPSITVATRKLFTQLDYAGLKDIGWQTQSVPFEFSPGLGLVLVGGLYGLNKAKKTVFKK
jgi:hypothetical protein